MKTYSFMTYVPQRYDINKFKQTAHLGYVRNFIYGFKSGKKWAVNRAAELVSNSLLHWYGDECKNFVIACVPASTEKENRKRFRHFVSVVSKKCGMKSTNNHIHVIGERDALHRSVNHMVKEDNYTIYIDKEFFLGKTVIIFDDLITTGTTANRFAELLTQAGATVKGGLFLARTMFNKQ